VLLVLVLVALVSFLTFAVADVFKIPPVIRTQEGYVQS
jgi:hypothetical protein